MPEIEKDDQLNTPKDAPVAAPIETEPEVTRPFSVVIPLVVSMGFFMEALDQNIVTASIPTMAREFGVLPEQLGLSITAYIISVALFIPMSGWVADRFGARRVLLTAICIFVSASVLCGLAQNLPMLVGARILQGFGGALMLPVGRLVILRSFSSHDLVRAITWMTMPVIMGPLLGPVIGGFFTTYMSWRLIFFINVPVGIMAFLLAWRFIPAMPPEGARQFDFPGFALLALGIVAFQASIELLLHPQVPGLSIGALFLASLVLLTFFVRYARRAANPILSLGLLRIRAFRLGIFAGGLSRIGFNAVPFLLQLKLQLVLGYSPFEAGSIVLVIALGALSLKPLTVRMLRWFGFRKLLAGNALIGALITAGFALFDADASLWVLVVYTFAFGIVRSLQFNAVNSLTYAEVPRANQSGSVAFGGVAQQLSMGLGVALASVALAQGATANLVTFNWAFVAMAIIPLLSFIGFAALLRTEDGAEASGHRS